MTSLEQLDLSRPDLRLSIGDRHEPTALLFDTWAMRNGVTHHRATSWPTDRDTVPPLGVILAESDTKFLHCRLIHCDGALCNLQLRDGTLNVVLAGWDRESLDSVERRLRELIPAQDAAVDEGAVRVSFWSYGTHGADLLNRRLAIPSWDEVRLNYPPRVAEELDELMTHFRFDESGQLLLWHGPPGTGKTHALRALAGAWREWCTLHYIVDPETFFGQQPDYMLQVLLHEEEERPSLLGPSKNRERWRLLILEDAGEMLATDAKERMGQAVSRLLNVVDGLIGQGLRILVLVTGNEPLAKLHPALSRPGRCASIVEFEKFDESEATAWLARHGVDAEHRGSAGLSDLFALLDGRVGARPETAVGFG